VNLSTKAEIERCGEHEDASIGDDMAPKIPKADVYKGEDYEDHAQD
jgi:hypothetical protein